jgi:hypothetical protein
LVRDSSAKELAHGRDPRARNRTHATLNYIVDDGEKIFTVTAAPDGTDVRSAGTPDPRRVTILNGRPRVDDFVIERDGFRLVRHDTKVANFLDEAEVRRPHTAFEDPTSPPNARPRESIEIRTLAFF